MGIQLSECFIEHSYPVVLKTRFISNEDSIRSKITKHLAKRGNEKYVDDCFSFLTITESFNLLSDCDLIIESVVEDYHVKCSIFSSLARVIKSDTIVVTNTSALSVSRLSDEMPGLTGFHFFNPIYHMKLVEIVCGKNTSAETINLLKQLSISIDKESIVVSDSPGFLVNRLLLPQINNAIKMTEAGIASKEDIDKAVRLGLNHPMGPFELADYIGLDVCCNILDEMFEVYNDPIYRPAISLKEKVSENKLGYKTGLGFYDYSKK